MMINKMISAILIVAFIQQSSSQDINTDTRSDTSGCADVKVQKNFNIEKFAGHWYEVARNPTLSETILKCIQYNFTVRGDYVSSIFYGINRITGNQNTIEGRAFVPDTKEPAKLEVRYLLMPFTNKYWILDTNYDEYAVVYGCTKYLWIFGRNATLNETTKNKIYKDLMENKITPNFLITSEQEC